MNCTLTGRHIFPVEGMVVRAVHKYLVRGGESTAAEQANTSRFLARVCVWRILITGGGVGVDGGHIGDRIAEIMVRWRWWW